VTSSSDGNPRPSRGTGASEVAPGLFVGGVADARTFDGRKFSVRDEPPEEGLRCDAHLAVYDPDGDRPSRENLDRLYELVERVRGPHERVLVFCGHGIRRGPLAAAWILHRRDGISLDDAYERIRRVRPGVETPDEWLSDLRPLADRPGTPERRDR
jgi:hypothetical protein